MKNFHYSLEWQVLPIPGQASSLFLHTFKVSSYFLNTDEQNCRLFHIGGHQAQYRALILRIFLHRIQTRIVLAFLCLNYSVKKLIQSFYVHFQIYRIFLICYELLAHARMENGG